MKRYLTLLLGVLAVAAGCQKTESNTEIVLEISTNIAVPAGMNLLSLKITAEGKPEPFLKKYPLGTGPGQMTLPRRTTLYPLDNNDIGKTLSVLVEGLLDNKTVVSRAVSTKFAKGESKLLSIELLQKCVGQVCPNNQTCTPSAFCADPFIDPTNLPRFDSSKAPNTPRLDPDAGVSVDAPVDQSTSDGKTDGLSGKDGPPSPDRMNSDGQTGLDGTTITPDTSLGVDAPSINVDGPGVTVPDGSVAVDGPALVNPDAAVDAPVKVPDAPPASKTKGVACGAPGECESGLCVDGVCCEGKCDGMCMACNVPGKLGTCAPTPLNDPSNGDCPDDGIATCGRNGKCNGQGGCMMYPMGVACSAETCPAQTPSHTGPGLCDGQGHCGQGQPQDCTPFLCNSTSKTCNPTCTGDSDCVAPNKCIGGSCGKKNNGQPCSVPGDCQSNVCAQGVCCAGPCTELCKSCAVEGSLGTCTSVPAGKPEAQARCQDMGVNTCGTNGLCDGAGACQKYANGLVCGNQCNPGEASFTTSTCSAGLCAPGAPQPCMPYSCDSSGCKKSCSVPSDCAPGFMCGAGGLCVRPPEDCMNGVDDDGDGQVDCADTDCQAAGFMCVPTVPSGFTGPVELFEGAAADMPKCDGPYPVESFTGWGSLACPFSCSTCNCGSPKDVTCGNPSISFDADRGTCRPLDIKPMPLVPGTCYTLSDTSYTLFATWEGRASGGSCDSTGGGQITRLPASWNAARVCGGQIKGGGGCASGLMCWPTPQKPYQTQACIMGSGNQACPASGYTNKRDYFETQDFTDGRQCTGCGCASPTGVSCNAAVTLFAAPPIIGKETIPCTTTSEIVKVPTDCQKEPLNIGYVRSSIPAVPFTGGLCAGTGGEPTGTCTPTGKQATVCCMP